MEVSLWDSLVRLRSRSTPSLFLHPTAPHSPGGDGGLEVLLVVDGHGRRGRDDGRRLGSWGCAGGRVGWDMYRVTETGMRRWAKGGDIVRVVG